MAYFDKSLIEKYQVSCPRYTSYPTANHFHENFSENDYIRIARRMNQDSNPSPLSLYFHIPFCRHICFYCACNKIVTNNHKKTFPYLSAIHREIGLKAKLFEKDRQVDQLHWGGGTPTYIDHIQMRELMKCTKKHFQLRTDDKGDYSLEIDPREAGEGTIALLRGLGFNRLSLGVQDFNPTVQKAINRIQTVEETHDLVKEAESEGYHSINIDLIYGLPNQTIESFKDTLNIIKEMDPDRIAVYNYAHLPGFFKSQRMIREDDLPGFEEKMDILRFTINYLTNHGYIYIGMDHFAKPDDELSIAQNNNTLHRNFQGYSTHVDCDIIGMGVSAISCVGNCYAQNTCKLDDYVRNISIGKIPVIRGVELNMDDLLRRDVISKLMCHYYVNYSEINATHGIEFCEYFQVEIMSLAKMERDGLVAIGADEIRVTSRGRLLIRNICMIFDKYLCPMNTNGRFSRAI